MEHVCDERCSWKQTAETLRAAGYPVGDYTGEDPFGGIALKIKHQAQMSEALHRAWLDGKVRLCTKHTRA